MIPLYLLILCLLFSKSIFPLAKCLGFFLNLYFLCCKGKFWTGTVLLLRQSYFAKLSNYYFEPKLYYSWGNYFPFSPPFSLPGHFSCQGCISSKSAEIVLPSNMRWRTKYIQWMNESFRGNGIFLFWTVTKSPCILSCWSGPEYGYFVGS